MDFTSNQSDNWGTDEFQDKFIRDYFGNKSTGKDCERSSRNKRQAPNAESPPKRQKINTSIDFIKSANTENGTINKRLLKLANSKVSLKLKTKKKSFRKEQRIHSPIKAPKTVEKCLAASKFSADRSANTSKSDESYQDSFCSDISTECESLLNDVNTDGKIKSKGKNVLAKVSKKLSDSFNSSKGEEHITSKFKLYGKKDKSVSLRAKALANMQAAKFRLLNEKLYTATSNEAFSYFHDDAEAFSDYHNGYQEQVQKWPINPVDLIIKDLRNRPRNLVIADLGCGDAKIARTFRKQKIYSFDLVALNEHVTACDMSKVPLPKESVDIVVFCLSLMGTNLKEFILQAFRILKKGGLLKIAEVESRIENLKAFIKSIEAYGFSLSNKDESHKMFLLLDFNKVKKKTATDGPEIKLNACFYKKR